MSNEKTNDFIDLALPLTKSHIHGKLKKNSS